MAQAVRVEHVGKASIVAAAVVAILFAIVSVLSFAEYNQLKTQNDSFAVCTPAAKDLNEATFFLAEQCQLYVTTTDTRYLNSYFEEVNVNKRREKALDQLRQYHEGSLAFEALKTAMSSCKTIEAKEHYAMKLVCQATEVPFNDQPTEIQSIILESEDQVLSPQEQLNKARSIVLSEEYRNARTAISTKVSECVASLTTQTKIKQDDASHTFRILYSLAILGAILMAVLLVIMCVIVHGLVVTPLKVFDTSIRQNKLLPLKGARELQSLAKIYNHVFTANAEAQRIIRHEAEHDALTGALNRRAFDKLMEHHEKQGDDFALILVDLDYFKNINDTYGHEVGDEVLKSTVKALMQSFRNADYICRVGGDEFAVIMVGTNSSMTDVVEDKIHRVMDRLNAEGEDLPEITLSIGIAFNEPNPDGTRHTYRNADRALYLTKEEGRNGHTFYKAV